MIVSNIANDITAVGLFLIVHGCDIAELDTNVFSLIIKAITTGF